MVVVAALLVMGNVHVLYPHLAVIHIAERIHQACLALADTLNLGTGQHNAAGIVIKQGVVKRSTLVLDVYRPGFIIFLTHIRDKGTKKRTSNHLILSIFFSGLP